MFVKNKNRNPMNSEIGKVYSIFGNKCPRCLEGDFFILKNPFWPGFEKMNDKCNVCDQKYNLETGFYYGAMYTSYIINVGIFVMAWVISYLLLPEEASVWATVAITIGIGLFMAPLTFRWSRLLWINFFVSHEHKLKNTVKKN
jgi:uncharacterized protein (DUF983 family)